MFSPSSIQSLLQERGIAPSKGRGQNFLIDKNILRIMVKAADIGERDTVVEVGPGLGILTQELVQKAGKVIAVEYDKKLAAFLRERFVAEPRLTLVEDDILKTPNAMFGTHPYKVVANLPYNITSAVMEKFQTEDPRPTECVIMVQKEVGERMLAKKGDMNLLALSVALYGSAKIVKKVSPGSFWPKPKVWSAMVKIEVGKHPFSSSEEEKFFWKAAKAGFSAKRKRLVSNLANAFSIKKEAVEGLFSELGLSFNARAQELGVEEWMMLAKKLTLRDK